MPSAPSPCSRSRSASSPSSTTTSPSWPPSSTPSTSCGPTSRPRRSRPSSTSRASRPATGCSSSLLDSVDVPVPDGIVEAEVHQHLEGENRLDDDEHRAEVDESTRKALKAQFLLDAIAEKLEVRVEQPELIEYLVMSAQQYGMDPNEFAQNIDQQGQIPSIVQEVARRKALAAVLDRATVTDTAGTRIDLDELVARPAGDDAELEADEAELVVEDDAVEPDDAERPSQVTQA